MSLAAASVAPPGSARSTTSRLRGGVGPPGGRGRCRGGRVAAAPDWVTGPTDRPRAGSCSGGSRAGPRARSGCSAARRRAGSRGAARVLDEAAGRRASRGPGRGGVRHPILGVRAPRRAHDVHFPQQLGRRRRRRLHAGQLGAHAAVGAARTRGARETGAGRGRTRPAAATRGSARPGQPHRRTSRPGTATPSDGRVARGHPRQVTIGGSRAQPLLARRRHRSVQRRRSDHQRCSSRVKETATGLLPPTGGRTARRHVVQRRNAAATLPARARGGRRPRRRGPPTMASSRLPKPSTGPRQPSSARVNSLTTAVSAAGRLRVADIRAGALAARSARVLSRRLDPRAPVGHARRLRLQPPPLGVDPVRTQGRPPPPDLRWMASVVGSSSGSGSRARPGPHNRPGICATASARWPALTARDRQAPADGRGG